MEKVRMGSKKPRHLFSFYDDLVDTDTTNVDKVKTEGK
jgi:hypothetical protein